MIVTKKLIVDRLIRGFYV